MPRPKKDATDSKKKTMLADATKSLAAKTEKVKKAVTEKVTATKPAAKKGRPAKKAEEPALKANVVLQYGEKNVTFDTLVVNAKNKFKYDMNGDDSAIKNLELYVKPEENKVYFVADGVEGEYDL